MDDFISVIIPTYNRPRQLSACLTALAATDYPRSRFEVIVVDDGGSTPLDPVIAVFKSSLPVRLLRQKQSGPGAARNAGAAIARGRFLAFTDDDCLPHAPWLAEFARQFARDPRCLCGGQTANALHRNPYAVTSQLIVDVCYAHFNADPAQAVFFASNNMAVPADQFATLGGFDESFRTSEDRDLCGRWLGRGFSLVYVPEARIAHAHQMNFAGFYRQHFHYGRGAWRFHSRRNAGGPARFSPDWSFYRRFVALPASLHPPSRAWAVALLLIVWQLANAAGFFWQRLSTLFNRPDPRPSKGERSSDAYSRRAPRPTQ